jgi:hypothetical protein
MGSNLFQREETDSKQKKRVLKNVGKMNTI